MREVRATLLSFIAFIYPSVPAVRLCGDREMACLLPSFHIAYPFRFCSSCLGFA
jgi:hypothetical protein